MVSGMSASLIVMRWIHFTSAVALTGVFSFRLLVGDPAFEQGDRAGHRLDLEGLTGRLMQIAIAALTIFATAWCYQMHIALGLTATFLAKHILVAILAAGLRLPMRDVKP